MSRFIVIAESHARKPSDTELDNAIIRLLGADSSRLAWRRRRWAKRALAALHDDLARTGTAAFKSLQIVRPDYPKSHSLTASTLTFVEGVIYIQHPVDSAFYLPLADFHRYVFEEKRQEFLTLCSALGAKRISLSNCDNSWRRIEGDAHLTVSPVQRGGQRVSAESAKHVSFSLAAVYSKPPAFPPRAPERLRWLPSEPSWQEMAHSRIEAQRASLTVRVCNTQNHGVDAELGATFKYLGFSIGGEFQEFHEVDECYDIEFFRSGEYSVASGPDNNFVGMSVDGTWKGEFDGRGCGKMYGYSEILRLAQQGAMVTGTLTVDTWDWNNDEKVNPRQFEYLFRGAVRNISLSGQWWNDSSSACGVLLFRQLDERTLSGRCVYFGSDSGLADGVVSDAYTLERRSF